MYKILLVFLCLLILLPCKGFPEIYVFTDENGVIHFTNVPNDLRYRLFYRTYRKAKREKPLEGSPKFKELIEKISNKYGINSDLIKAVIKAESDFDPRAISEDGARGLMQLLPQKARELRVMNIHDAEDNIEGGVKHLKELIETFGGNITLALAAYNAGKGAVMKYNGIPPYPETVEYIRRVLRYFRGYRSGTRF